jgi:hypothetical protein
MGYNNQFFLGVTSDVFFFTLPPRKVTDSEMVELLALALTMKPKLLPQVEERVKEMMKP